MRFIVPVPLEQAKRALLSHQSEIPVLADTDIAINEWGDRWDAQPVEIPRGLNATALNTQKTPATSVEYVLKRQWKGGKGLFHYPVMGFSGRLESISADVTAVTLNFNFYIMGYVGIAALVIGLLLTGSQRESGLGLILFFGILALFLIDFYVLSRVYTTLRSGTRM